MSVKLNLWQSGTGFARIYLNGLPVAGKAWLQASRGMTAVHFEQGAAGMPESDVMALVAVAAGCDPTRWNDLLAVVEAMPKPVRGRQPGTMAANRRASAEAPPAAWTAEHADELDPNEMAHPLTQETTLIVDDREPAEMVDLLRAVTNLKVEIASLETGDYLVPGKLVIERKTAADLVTSVIDESKRLFSQTDRVASSGMRGVLLLEGDIYRQTNMKLPAIAGTLSYLAVIQGISVMETMSLKHSAYMIVKMVRHAVEGLGYELQLRGSGPKDPAKAAAFVIEGIPGVSATTAKTLLAAFGSVAGLANANYEELLAVPGVGPKRAEQIFQTLRAGPASES